MLIINNFHGLRYRIGEPDILNVMILIGIVGTALALTGVDEYPVAAALAVALRPLDSLDLKALVR